MKWVGLTGGLASGKSTVTKALQAKGFPVIDADKIAREVVAAGTPGLQSVLTALGAHLLNSDGELDRARLAKEIFFDPQKKEQLEKILHPLIREDVQKRRQILQERGEKIAFYDVPLLYETQSQNSFDAVVVVTCSRQTQIKRLKQRNNWSNEEIEARLASQLPLADKEKWADFVIHNEGSLADLEADIERAVIWIKSF